MTLSDRDRGDGDEQEGELGLVQVEHMRGRDRHLPGQHLLRVQGDRVQESLGVEELQVAGQKVSSQVRY